MADLRDEHGNPVQLADKYGKPVELKDEYGKPMHITGVVSTTQTVGGLMSRERHDPLHTGEQLHHPSGVAVTEAVAPPVQAQPTQPVMHDPQDQLPRSTSSSSSSEEDGEGGRRKKKGLKEKIKETFGGGKHKDEVAHGTPTTTATTTGEKKGVLGKIKDKLPGHHP